MNRSGMSVAQKQDAHGLVDQNQILDGVPFLFPDIETYLCVGINGTPDRPLDSIIVKRGGSFSSSKFSRRPSIERLGETLRFSRVFLKRGSSTRIHMFVFPKGNPNM